MLTGRWRRSVVVLALAALGAMALGCASGGGESKESSAKPGASSGESETVTIAMKDNFFEPKEITVEKGHAITFIAKNEGQVIHDVHIISSATEGKDIISNPTIQAGESNTFKATFTKAGTLKFQCDYHLPDMVGTITVK